MYIRINGKRKWVVYTINSKTKQIIDFALGSKSNETISKVVNTVLLLHPKKIYTDRFPSYKSIIPNFTHRMIRFQTNIIERFNLNLRTHLKRLSRKSLCNTKNRVILEATLKLYFWDNQLNFR